MRVQRGFGLLLAGISVLALSARIPGVHADPPPPTYTVTDFNDEDGTCPDDSKCTLRTAIGLANATTGAKIVMMPLGGGSPRTIKLNQALDAITAPMSIDGTGQASSNTPTPGTVLDGSGLDGTAKSSAFHLMAGGTTTIHGFVIINFAGPGVLIDDSTGRDTLSTNYIGVQSDGSTPAANAVGVVINGSPSNVIGAGLATSGTSVGATANLISGNTGAGVEIQGAGATANRVAGNIIGANKTGMSAVPNGEGVFIHTGAAMTQILADLISGNGATNASGDGVHLDGAGPGNVINLDLIGVTLDQMHTLGNAGAGVYINNTSGTTVGKTTDTSGNGNVIQANAKGVVVAGATSVGNVIAYNQMSQNLAIGIDLGDDGVTANDAGDTDTGPNSLQNYPVISGAWNDGGNTVVTGALDSTAGAFTIQLFSSTTCSASRNGEGATFISNNSMQTSGRFQFRLSSQVSAGAVVTATATGSSGTSEFSLCQTVQTCPTITVGPPTLPDVTEEMAYTAMITATGSADPATYSFKVTSGTLPTGLTLNPGLDPATATLSGTTTDHGQHSFTVTAVDENGCSGSNVYALNVTCPAITMMPATLPGGTMGQAYNQTLSASGGGGSYTFTVTSGTLPAGLLLATDGTISGTPTGSGTSDFTVTATDGAGCTTSMLYSIVVASGCQALGVAPATLPGGMMGVAYPTTQLTASGGTQPYTFLLSGGALPNGLVLASDGTLSGTPTVPGMFMFTVSANDSLGCNGSRDYMVTITMACTAITIAPATLPAGMIGMQYSATLVASGGTAPVHLAADSLPPGLMLDPASGALTGSPTHTGTTMFTVTATDASGCTGTHMYSLQVTSTCPQISLSPTTLPDGTAETNYSQPLSASGGTGPYSFAILAGQLPGVTLSSSGLLSGIPSTEGTFQLAITVTDANHCSAGATYAVTICAPIDLSPTQLADATRGVPYSTMIVASGGEAPYDYTLTGGSLPGGLALDGAGNLTGTPTATGDFSFTVSVADALSCHGTRSYAVTVTKPSCPTLSLQPTSLPDGTVGQSYQASFVASGGAAPYSYGVRTGSLPPGLSLSTDGALTGQPTTPGHSNFTVGAADANACTTALAYSVTVVAACGTLTVTPPTLPDATAGTAYDQTLGASGGTAPYAFTVSDGLLPDGLSLSLSGEISGTATSAGSSGFTILVTDASGCTGSATYSFSVASPGCANIAISPLMLLDGVIGSAYQQTFTASGGTAPYTWSTSGTPPAGLTMSTDGMLSGTPTAAGSSTFAVIAHDGAGCQTARQYTLSVACAPTGCPAVDAGVIDARPGADSPPTPDAATTDAGSAPAGDAGDGGMGGTSSGGCQVGAPGGTGGAAGIVLWAGLGLLALRRRRRVNSRPPGSRAG